MSISVRLFANNAGAELLGLDLTKPLDETTFAAVHQAYVDYGMLLIRGQQRVTHRQYTDFASRFDPLMVGYPQASGYQQEDAAHFRKEKDDSGRFAHPENPYIFVISNVKKNGRPIGLAKAGQYWHSDMYFIDRPAHSSTLFAQEIPPAGGDTLAINMYQVYDALPELTKQRIDDLQILLSYYRAWTYIYPTRAPMSQQDRLNTPDVIHSLVQTHPQSGRKVLYLGALFSDENPGAEIIELPYEEGKALYAKLRDFALQPRFIYSHRWQVGDIFIMDNRCCMHSGTEWDDTNYTRTLYRTTGIGVKTGRIVAVDTSESGLSRTFDTAEDAQTLYDRCQRRR